MCRLAFTLSGSVPRNFRILCEIERVLRSMQRTGYNSYRVERHKLEIQEILDTLNAPTPPVDETPSVDERGVKLAPTDRCDAATTSAPESGTSFVPPSRTLYGILITPYFSTSTLQSVDV